MHGSQLAGSKVHALGRPGESWVPGTSRKARTLSSLARAVAGSFAAWVLLLALSIDLLALAVEPGLLLIAGSPPRAALASLCGALGLSTLFSLAAALPVASVYSLARWIGRMPRPWSLGWPLPLFGLAWGVVFAVAPDPFVRLVDRGVARFAAFALFSAWLVLATLVARSRGGTARAVAAAFLAEATLALSFALPPTVHREPRDLLWLCTVAGCSAALYPIRRRLAAGSPVGLARALVGLCASSPALLLAAWAICPSWRVYAKDHGRFAERLGRFCRTLADFDGDGYSAVLGGLDCDDFDPLRHPAMPERLDGRDRNCNGVTRPASPTPAQRGLSPEAGEADAPAGAIDRVVLVTIDCLRSDALTAEVMPRLTRLASRGVTFTRLYAGGARTATSLPLLLRGAYPSPPVALLLAAEGTSSTAVFAYRHSTLGDNVFRGFGKVEVPPRIDARWRAAQVTQRALEDLRDSSAERSHLLWVHYFDAHGPRSARVLPGDTARFAPLPGEGAESALYLSELSYIDRQVGHLIDGIDRMRGAGRTMIVVTGDHGEAFGLHGAFEHGESAFEQVVHVPGIFVAPGIAPGVYDHVVSHRDIAATILGAFGLAAKYPGSEEFGRSWFRMRAAPRAPLHDFVVTYSSSAHVQSWAAAPLAVRTDDRAKLAVAYRDGIERFYHLDAGGGEARDVAHDYPEEAARDRRELEIYRDIDTPPP